MYLLVICYMGHEAMASEGWSVYTSMPTQSADKFTHIPIRSAMFTNVFALKLLLSPLPLHYD